MKDVVCLKNDDEKKKKRLRLEGKIRGLCMGECMSQSVTRDSSSLSLCVIPAWNRMKEMNEVQGVGKIQITQLINVVGTVTNNTNSVCNWILIGSEANNM